MKTTILICSHKEVELPNNELFFPIQAGAALHEKINGYQSDDDGENISIKNPHFCELTCHYWAWKNLRNVDIIGLNHYRRYFDFDCKWPYFSPDKHFISTDRFLQNPYHFPNIEKLIEKCDIILPPKRHWRVSNTQQYAEYHIAKDWEVLRQIISELSPEYIPAFEKTMDHDNKAVGYNMFITKWNIFDKYSEWLFKILFEVERRVQPIDDPIQSRIYGYMSERLINVYCAKHHLRITHVPIIMPIDNFQEVLNVSHLHATYRRIVNDIIYLLNK